MSDISDAISEAVEKGRESHLNSIIAAMVAFTATLTALCNVKDGNVVQAMAQAQTQSVDEWAYYQAKSTKQYIAETVVDQLTTLRDTTPGITAEARARIDARVAAYADQAKKYEAEKKEIGKKAEGLQKEYDRLNIHDDQFDMAEASLSIAIALFGITALTQKRWLAGVATFFTLFGATLGMAGFLNWNLHPDLLAKLLS